MKKLLVLFLSFSIFPVFSQIKMELTPQGFAPVDIARPDVPLQKLEDRIRAWVSTYNEKNEFGYDIYAVTDNGLKIDAHKMNAFYYRNRGEAYQHRIKYTLRVDYLEKTLRVRFSIAEVYAGKNLLELSVADLFNPDGKLKGDYLDAKPSLEKTAGNIVGSFAVFLSETN